MTPVAYTSAIRDVPMDAALLSQRDTEFDDKNPAGKSRKTRPHSKPLCFQPTDDVGSANVCVDAAYPPIGSPSVLLRSPEPVGYAPAKNLSFPAAHVVPGWRAPVDDAARRQHTVASAKGRFVFTSAPVAAIGSLRK